MTTTTPSPDQVSRDPFLFAETFLKIQDKRMRKIPLRYNPIQRDYLSKRTSRDLILKPRQIGFSTLIQAEHFRYKTTRAAATLTIAKDDENTKDMRRIANYYYDKLPEDFRPQRGYDNDVEQTFPLIGSRSAIIKAGSRDPGRGGTRTHIHGSEVAFWSDAQKLVKGALQAGDPLWVVFESTPNGASGWFYERCMEAIKGEGAWTLHFYTWFDNPDYTLPVHPDERLSYTSDELEVIEKHRLTAGQIKWRRAKIKEIGSLDDFLEQYPEDPYSCFKRSGIGYFGDIDAFFNAPIDVVWDQAHRYVAGLDFGQQRDYTVLVIIDVHTLKMVDSLRINKRSWEDMRAQVRAMCKKWNVAVLTPEANSVGSVNVEQMLVEFYRDGLRTTINPFNMTAASKPPLMAGLRVGLHETGLRLQPIDQMKHEFNAAVSKLTQRGWTVESPHDADGHGDYVIATALAWHSVSFIRG